MPGVKRRRHVGNIEHIDVRWQLVVQTIHYFARSEPLDPLTQRRRTAAPPRKLDGRNLRHGVDSGIRSSRAAKLEWPLKEDLRCPVKLTADRARICLRLPAAVSCTVKFKGYFKCPHNKI